MKLEFPCYPKLQKIETVWKASESLGSTALIRVTFHDHKGTSQIDFLKTYMELGKMGHKIEP